jgi:hypothetical protein
MALLVSGIRVRTGTRVGEAPATPAAAQICHSRPGRRCRERRCARRLSHQSDGRQNDDAPGAPTETVGRGFTGSENGALRSYPMLSPSPARRQGALVLLKRARKTFPACPFGSPTQRRRIPTVARGSRSRSGRSAQRAPSHPCWVHLASAASRASPRDAAHRQHHGTSAGGTETS